jgi:hypothetical protein
MRTTFAIFTALALGVAAEGAALASSHREALAVINDPCIDNTDLYAWVKPGTHDKLYLIQGYYGVVEPGQGNQQVRLCDDVLYEFHVTKGVGMLRDFVTYQIKFSSTKPTQVDAGDLNLPPGGGKELLVQLSGGVQTYTVTEVRNGHSTVLASNVPVAPPNVGPRTDRIAYGLGTYDAANPAGPSSNDALYNDAFAATFIKPLMSGGQQVGRVWAGTRDDPFYLDEKGIFDILNIHASNPSYAGKDVFAGFNVNMIALEIDTTEVLGGAIPHPGVCAKQGDNGDSLLGVWNSASRRKFHVLRANGNDDNFGAWVQVGREGLPLIDAGMIGTQDQTKYLRTTPMTDVANFAAYFLNPILVRDAEFLGIYNQLGVPGATVQTLKSGRTDILDVINLKNIPAAGCHPDVQIAPGMTGDVLRVDVSIDSQFPNGRAIWQPGQAADNAENVDVSDVLISLILAGDPGAGIGDNVNHNDKNYLQEFPFAALPWQGLFQGHGAIAQ